MANTVNGNTVYIDSTGTISMSVKNVKVTRLMFTSAGAGDNLILRDTDGSGDLKVSIKNKNAAETVDFIFGENALLFPNAIHIDTLTAGATATIIFRLGV